MKKHRRGDNIFIDLTSLLDVVMIVLLVVICQLQLTKSSAADTDTEALLAAAEAETEEAQKTQDLYNSQLNSIENLSDYVVFISVTAPYEKDLETRHILLLASDDASGNPQEIAELKGAVVTDGYEALEQYLENAASKDPSRTIVLSLNENDERILYRDQTRIREIFDKLCAGHENVRASKR